MPTKRHTKRRTSFPSPDEPAQLLRLAELGCNRICWRIAGRCTPGLAPLLKRWRDERRYKAYCSRWSAFCVQHLNITRSEADKLIRMWEQYGDRFFQLAAVTRITASTFRHIAPAVKDGALYFRGQAIPLLPEYAEEIARAVAVLRSDLPRRKRGKAASLPATMQVPSLSPKSGAAPGCRTLKMPASPAQFIDIRVFTLRAK
jgi:hypothetical protein